MALGLAGATLCLYWFTSVVSRFRVAHYKPTKAGASPHAALGEAEAEYCIFTEHWNASRTTAYPLRKLARLATGRRNCYTSEIEL